MEETEIMAVVICPDCKNEVSEYAESCPKCGFPVSKFMNENELTDTEKKFICPKCGFCNGWDDGKDSSIYLRCKYCNTTMVQTDETDEEVTNNFIKYSAKENYLKTLAMKFSKDKFSEDEFQKREKIAKDRRDNKNSFNKYLLYQSPQQTQSSTSQVTCPYCKSTNCKKISSGSRWLSTGLFGLSSKKIGKQWHCNSCGSDF